MQHERSQEPELAALESQLAELVPRVEIDRDRFMFAAGARSARGKLLVMNRLLAAACALLAVTTIAPLAIRERAGEAAHAEREPANFKSVAPATRTTVANATEVRELPDQLIVADSRELAAALAEGRSELRPERLRGLDDEIAGAVDGVETNAVRPKSSRMLLREYLEARGEPL